MSLVADTISLWLARIAFTSSLLIESPVACGWDPACCCTAIPPPYIGVEGTVMSVQFQSMFKGFD